MKTFWPLLFITLKIIAIVRLSSFQAFASCCCCCCCFLYLACSPIIYALYGCRCCFTLFVLLFCRMCLYVCMHLKKTIWQIFSRNSSSRFHTIHIQLSGIPFQFLALPSPNYCFVIVFNISTYHSKYSFDFEVMCACVVFAVFFPLFFFFGSWMAIIAMCDLYLLSASPQNTHVIVFLKTKHNFFLFKFCFCSCSRIAFAEISHSVCSVCAHSLWGLSIRY